MPEKEAQLRYVNLMGLLFFIVNSAAYIIF